MKLSTVIIAAALCVGTVDAETKDYRSYLTSIDGFDRWFRVGSYSLVVNGEVTPIDIFYSDSDSRPDGKEPTWQVYPNSFGLFCVWRSADGIWHHKEVAGASRVTFSSIVTVEKDHIELDLRPKFRAVIHPNEDIAKQWQRIEEINKPFRKILLFEEGAPILREPEQTKAEQAGAGQPATRPESDTEGGVKPQPEAEGRSR
jgi:hypothetical protein